MRTFTRKEILANRAALVAALRSGEYAQTQDILRNHDGYCCLGVACEISGLVAWPQAPFGLAVAIDDVQDQSETLLPALVAASLGWESNGEFVEKQVIQGETAYSLADANDRGATFEKIADLIEDGLVQEV